MKSSDFQNNSHLSPKKEEDFTKKIIPFKRKREKVRPKPERSSGAQIITLPKQPKKTSSPRTPLRSLKTPRSDNRLIGLIILILILALLLAL
ncbi:MAG: hypothetical protein AB1847_19585 [bacterium]